MDRTEQAVLFEELAPDEQRAFKAALEEDQALAEAFDTWKALKGSLRQAWEVRVPDRDILVLYALAEAGRVDRLTDEERAALDAARPTLQLRLHEHPSLEAVVARIQEDCAVFEGTWVEHTQPIPSNGRQVFDRPARVWEDRPAVPARRAMFWVSRIAAALAVVAVVATLFLLSRPGTHAVTVTTGSNDVQDIQLADGTSVRLMGNSALRYTQAGDDEPFDRNVTLQGDAYFDVVHDPAHPFRVETQGATTTVLGTSFGIAAHDEMTEVVLAAGTVALASKANPYHRVMLKPGHKSHVMAAGPPSDPVLVDIVEALEWTGFLVFSGQTYAKIASHLSRHYGVVVEVDSALANQRMGNGTFEQEHGLEATLAVIARSIEAEVKGSASDGFRLVPKP